MKKKRAPRQTLGERVIRLEKDVFIIKSLLVAKLDEQAAGLRTVIDSLDALSRAVARIEERLSHVELKTEDLVVVKETT